MSKSVRALNPKIQTVQKLWTVEVPRFLPLSWQQFGPSCGQQPFSQSCWAWLPRFLLFQELILYARLAPCRRGTADAALDSVNTVIMLVLFLCPATAVTVWPYSRSLSKSFAPLVAATANTFCSQGSTISYFVVRLRVVLLVVGSCDTTIYEGD